MLGGVSPVLIPELDVKQGQGEQDQVELKQSRNLYPPPSRCEQQWGIFRPGQVRRDKQ